MMALFSYVSLIAIALTLPVAGRAQSSDASHPARRSVKSQSTSREALVKPQIVSGSGAELVSVAGIWVDSNNYKWTLAQTQYQVVSISGTVLVDPECPTQLWPVTGSVAGTQLSLTATNPTDGDSVCVSSVEYLMTAASSNASATGSWTYSDGESGAVSMSKTCDLPTTETTAFDGWDATYATDGKWKQTITNPNASNFSGVTVREANAVAGADTCYFTGSSFARFTSLSGGAWTVNADNTWGDDYIGWLPNSVAYYRAQGRAPCGFTVYQQMMLKCPDGSFQNYGAANALKGTMTGTTVTSVRAAGTASRKF
jgi:hypothetical protein